MAFTVKGTLFGQPVTVTYDDGKLSGTDFAVQEVRDQIGFRKNQMVSYSPGGCSYGDHLKNPGASLWIMQRVIQDSKVTGDLPTDLGPDVIDGPPPREK